MTPSFSTATRFSTSIAPSGVLSTVRRQGRVRAAAIFQEIKRRARDVPFEIIVDDAQLVRVERDPRAVVIVRPDPVVERLDCPEQIHRGVEIRVQRLFDENSFRRVRAVQRFHRRLHVRGGDVGDYHGVGLQLFVRDEIFGIRFIEDLNPHAAQQLPAFAHLGGADGIVFPERAVVGAIKLKIECGFVILADFFEGGAVKSFCDVARALHQDDVRAALVDNFFRGWWLRGLTELEKILNDRIERKNSRAGVVSDRDLRK